MFCKLQTSSVKSKSFLEFQYPQNVPPVSCVEFVVFKVSGGRLGAPGGALPRLLLAHTSSGAALVRREGERRDLLRRSYRGPEGIINYIQFKICCLEFFEKDEFF